MSGKRTKGGLGGETLGGMLAGFDRVYRMLDGRIASSARTSQLSGERPYAVAQE